jgi:hypothetical protein
MGARPYLPDLGRFLSADPVEGGCANDYEYVFGDPANSTDLDGRSTRTVRTGCSRGEHLYTDIFTIGAGGTAVLNAKVQIGSRSRWVRVEPILGEPPSRRGVKGGFHLDPIDWKYFWLSATSSKATITHIQLVTSTPTFIVLTANCIPAAAAPELIA